MVATTTVHSASHVDVANVVPRAATGLATEQTHSEDKACNINSQDSMEGGHKAQRK